MVFPHRRSLWIFGALFGAWLGGVYAFVSQAVNSLFLPGIPLMPASGNFTGAIIQYALLGALLGSVSAIPENRMAGTALGAFVTALLGVGMSLAKIWGSETIAGLLVVVLYTFLPFVVLMMPLAFVVRSGVDAQRVDPDRPYLWPRRYLIPALLTLLAIFLGSLSIYGSDVRQAIRYTDQMVRQGIMAGSQASLPKPLADVAGFDQNAQGSYQLSYSDNVETFFGPVPVEAELSQFLVIAHFDNGFAFACVFSANRNVPTCTNY